MDRDDARQSIVTAAARDSKSHKGRVALTVGIVVIILSFATSVYAALSVYGSTKDQATKGTNLAQQVQDACTDRIPNDASLQSLCSNANKVVDDAPAAVKGDKGDSGEPGPVGPAPSDAQVFRAVQAYCEGGACNGSNATRAQVAAAVATYCNAGGTCRGPRGTAGAAGSPGATGASGQQGAKGQDGQDGAPASESQIQQAVDTYCTSHDGCKGPEGPVGPQGDTGDTGVVNIETVGCGAQEGQVVDSVSTAYSPDTRTITVTCTQVSNGIAPPDNGGNQ